MEDLWTRAKELGYVATRRDLSRGESAQVADPVESSLWYVDYPEDVSAAFAADQTRWLERAKSVLDWHPGGEQLPLNDTDGEPRGKIRRAKRSKKPK